MARGSLRSQRNRAARCGGWSTHHGPEPRMNRPVTARRELSSWPHSNLHPIAEIAHRCNVSTKTVRRWIDAGELSYYRLGRQIRIGEQEFQAFLCKRQEG